MSEKRTLWRAVVGILKIGVRWVLHKITGKSTPIVPHFDTCRNGLCSLFQSAIEEAVQRQSGKKQRLDNSHPVIHAACALCKCVECGHDIPKNAPGEVTDKHGDSGSVAWTCVGLYWDVFKAEWEHDETAVAKAKNELKFSECDVEWLEAIVDYLKYFGIMGKKNEIPYVKFASQSDFVMEWLPPDATIALVGDWATGTETAKRVLEQIKTHKPDVVFHLGDIYYSGTETESQKWFLEIMDEVLNRNETKTPIYTLTGNHDMYSGGQGYYSIIKKLNPAPDYPADRAQEASYFCLRTTDHSWQFLAMDTGLNDHDPFDVSTSMTYLEPEEVSWHLDKLNGFSGKTVLMSHHQLFSAFAGIGNSDEKPDGEMAFNSHLLDSFRKFNEAGDIAAWFWGHEHSLSIYEPFGGLNRGCCIGHGAIPVFLANEPYKALEGEGPWPKVVRKNGLPVELDNDGVEYSHGFSILKLNGSNGPAVAKFYQDSQPGVAMFEIEL